LFDKDIFKAVIKEVAEVREVEIGCDECFEQLDRFVEMKLAGLDAARAMPLVHQHLEMCGECRDEFEAFLAALRATTQDRPST
jgi:bacterioferritin-associated ferredoxin